MRGGTRVDGAAATFVRADQKQGLRAAWIRVGQLVTELQCRTLLEHVGKRLDLQERPGSDSRRDGDDHYAKLVMQGGPSAGLSVADIVGAVTRAAGLDGEAVRDVQLLERFAFLAVPAGEADRVVDALSGESLRGRSLRLQRVPS